MSLSSTEELLLFLEIHFNPPPPEVGLDQILHRYVCIGANQVSRLCVMPRSILSLFESQWSNHYDLHDGFLSRNMPFGLLDAFITNLGRLGSTANREVLPSDRIVFA